MGFDLERLKFVLEPIGATALAALMSGRLDHHQRRVGVIAEDDYVNSDRLASERQLILTVSPADQEPPRQGGSGDAGSGCPGVRPRSARIYAAHQGGG